MSQRQVDREARDAWIRALEFMRTLDAMPQATLPAILNDHAIRHAERAALIDEHVTLSYAALAARCNRYSRWALGEGMQAGDVVCLMMQNSADYVAIWLGLTHIGCCVALINTSLVGDALAHSFAVAGPAHLIVAGKYRDVATEALGRRPLPCRLWVHGGGAGEMSQLEFAVSACDGAPLQATPYAPTGTDRALLIYTSGTTGMPKAAQVTHDRIMEWSGWFAGMMAIRPEDRLYDCLPMYHSTGGVVAIGATLLQGGSVVIRERFSASRFWEDIVENGCTIFQYIGELCRFLLRAPPHADERRHRLRLCCGNGLQGDVWQAFQERFAIPRILEFYAATEGCVSLYNCEGRPGAIGRVPGFLAHRFPVQLIRCDVTTGAPLRDGEGRCIPCASGEPGEAIGQLVAGSSTAARQFHGYTDPDASARKLLHDVFAPGDRWYRTGDLMRRDAAGFYYFVDRLGDTFRWKGENVATTEVAAVIGACPGVHDVAVYGVRVPGNEGRAGMAAITADDSLSLATLRSFMAERLPVYAQPLFLRLCVNLDMTGTFKLSKTTLANDGYQLSRGHDDPIWFNDRNSGRFITCDAALVAQIESGQVIL